MKNFTAILLACVFLFAFEINAIGAEAEQASASSVVS
jgi:hypothetical protein